MRRAVDHHQIVVFGDPLDLFLGPPAGDLTVDQVDLAFEGGGAGLIPAGQAALRVDIDQRHLFSGLHPGHRQMSRESGLAGAALLLRNGDDLTRHDLRPPSNTALIQ